MVTTCSRFQLFFFYSLYLGTGGHTKTYELWGKLQTIFDPPLIFGKCALQFFIFSCLKVQNLRFWIEKDSPPHLELFRKFVRFVRATRPYCRGHVWTTLLGSGHQGQGCLPLHQGGALGHNNLAKAMFFNAINFRSELM